MLRSKCLSPGPMRFARIVPAGCAVLMIGVAGCSTDVTRFNRPSLGASDDVSSSRSSAPVQTSNLFDNQPSREYGSAGISDPNSNVSTRALPYATEGAPAPQRVTTLNTGSVRTTIPVDRTPERTNAPIRVADASPTMSDRGYGQPLVSGQSITVQAGDTLYGLARTHGVTVDALKSANGLTSAMIRPGQVLALPGASAASYGRPVTGSAQPAPPSEPTYAGGESYTVRPGDSLYRISKSTGVSIADLQSVNGITDPTKLRPGQVLQLRQSQATPPVVAARRPLAPRTQSRELPAATGTPLVINTTKPGVATDATPGTPKAGDKYASLATPSGNTQTAFRWPVRGRVVSGFGPRKDGSHNDGIDISVPFGADIMAAEGGVVAYADSELKAYGNLILIRHDNGWVSAYAHADKILVKRGDRIERGQVIAKAGTTGSVDQPTLHFELRDGAKPVDPLPMLPRG